MSHRLVAGIFLGIVVVTAAALVAQTGKTYRAAQPTPAGQPD